MLTTLDHVVIAVRDLESASATYEKLLGRAASWRGAHPGYGTANTLFRLDNSYLELLAPAGQGPIAAQLEQLLETRGEGPAMLAFGTDDADALAKTLRERGIAAEEPAEGEGREQSSGALRRWRNVFLPDSDTRGVRMFAIEHLSPPDALPEATPSCGTGAFISGLDHVVIRSADADATAQLYGEKLGIRLALDRSFEQRGVRLLFFRVGGVTVEIGARLGAEPSDEPDSFWGIAYKVPDVAAAHARLVADGFDLTDVRDGNKPGTRVCTVKSETHGVPTLLIQPVAEANSARPAAQSLR